MWSPCSWQSAAQSSPRWPTSIPKGTCLVYMLTIDSYALDSIVHRDLAARNILLMRADDLPSVCIKSYSFLNLMQHACSASYQTLGWHVRLATRTITDPLLLRLLSAGWLLRVSCLPHGHQRQTYGKTTVMHIRDMCSFSLKVVWGCALGNCVLRHCTSIVLLLRHPVSPSVCTSLPVPFSLSVSSSFSRSHVVCRYHTSSSTTVRLLSMSCSAGRSTCHVQCQTIGMTLHPSNIIHTLT